MRLKREQEQDRFAVHFVIVYFFIVHFVIVVGHWHTPYENDPSAKHAGVGVLTSHHLMAATLLVSRPEHNAATPTWKRQGSLVTADALPILVGFLRP